MLVDDDIDTFDDPNDDIYSNEYIYICMISDDSIVYDSNVILGPRTPLWPLPNFLPVSGIRGPRVASQRALDLSGAVEYPQG